MHERRLEPTVGDMRLQIGIGGGDQPGVRGDRSGAANRVHLAGFEHPQEHDLNLWRSLTDLVQKQRAISGRPKESGTITPGAGECTLAHAKQLGGNQIAWDRTQIDTDKRTTAAGPVFV